MKTHARRLLIVGLLIVGAIGVRAQGVVAPASVTITNFRTEAQSFISDSTYFNDTTLRFTNCVMYSGATTNSSVQNLTGVTIEVSVGAASTNIAYSGTAQIATNGTWFSDITVPSFVSAPFLQVKITDASTNSFIYPWKIISSKASM